VTLSLRRASADRITDLIWLGSRVASADDYHHLRALGVRACVDMKHEGADPWTFEAFLWLPTLDHEAPTHTHLRMGMAFLRECERAKVPVFVACMAGVGRSSALVLAHLLAGRFREEGKDAALEFLCARRPAVRPNPEQVDAAVLAARDPG
jgi:predicted protein tyrosine phosphatase